MTVSNVADELDRPGLGHRNVPDIVDISADKINWSSSEKLTADVIHHKQCIWYREDSNRQLTTKHEERNRRK